MFKKYMGWTPNSKMPNVYVHLSQHNVNEAIIRIPSMMGGICHVEKNLKPWMKGLA